MVILKNIFRLVLVELISLRVNVHGLRIPVMSIFVAVDHSPTSDIDGAPLLELVAPQNQTVPTNVNVILACQFTKPVSCAWHRNGEKVDISSRHQYLSVAAATRDDAEDCSLVIKFVQLTDMGSWSCQGKAKNATQTVSSKPAFLSIRETPTKPTVLDNGIPIDALDLVFITEKLCCKAIGGNPPTKLYWEVNGVVNMTGMTQNTTRVSDGVIYDSELCWDSDRAKRWRHTVSKIRCVGIHPGYGRGFAYTDILAFNDADFTKNEEVTTLASDFIEILVFVVIAIAGGAAAIGLIVAFVKISSRCKKQKSESVELATVHSTKQKTPQVDITEDTYTEIISKRMSEGDYLVPKSDQQAPQMAPLVNPAEETYAEILLETPSEDDYLVPKRSGKSPQMAPQVNLAENTYTEIIPEPPSDADYLAAKSGKRAPQMAPQVNLTENTYTEIIPEPPLYVDFAEPASGRPPPLPSNVYANAFDMKKCP